MATGRDLLPSMLQLINDEAEDEATMLQSWFTSCQHSTLFQPVVASIAISLVR